MSKHIRLLAFWLASVAVISWYWATDPDHGADTIARLQWLAWMIVAAGPVYLLRRAFFDRARSKDAYTEAMRGNVGAGLVFLGLAMLTGMLFLAFAARSANGQTLPAPTMARVQQYLRMLRAEQQTHWPDAPIPAALAAQVEQETCPSLSSPKCWSPRAELKTSREYGFGLGQLTVTPKFDNFAAARSLHASLRDWQWADRYDPARQLRTMVLMDRSPYRSLTDAVPDPAERMAMALSAYNGGLGGVRNDRRLCAQVRSCDPARWWGHVELHSTKARTASAGYGRSFYAINREYVRNVLKVRLPRYEPLYADGGAK